MVQDQSMEDQVIALTRRLVGFDTVNPPGNEEAAMRDLGAYLSDRGLSVAYQEVAPERVNLIVRLPGRGEAGHLVLCGHMDVVPLGEAPWRHAPFAATHVEGRLYGRGTADMKGGVAAMAVAVATLAEAGFAPRGDLILAITAGEEEGLIGAKEMARSGILSGSAALVIGEPTGLNVYHGHKGGLKLLITAHGQTAHAALPQTGINAIAYMAAAITALQAHPFPFVPSALLGEPTVNVTKISGGVKSNVIPDHCTITVDVRTVPGQSRDEIMATTQGVLDAVAAQTGLPVRTQVEVPLYADPIVTPSDHPLVQAAVAAVTEVCGRAPLVGGVSYGTDAIQLVPAYGLPVVVCGPGRFEQAHQTDEYVEVAELTQATQIYLRLAQRVLG